MATIVVNEFFGANQATTPYSIPEGQGQECVNAKPGRGDLRGWLDVARVSNANISRGTQASIYRMGHLMDTPNSKWVVWDGVVNAVKCYDATDTTDRTAYTGDGGPKVFTLDDCGADGTPPQAHRPLGIPAPSKAPKVVGSLATPPDDVGKYEMRLTVPDIAGMGVGSVYRLLVGAREPQEFTVSAGIGGRPTAASLKQDLAGIGGVTTSDIAEDDLEAPRGLRVLGDQVGERWAIQKRTGVRQGGDVTDRVDLLGASGGGSGEQKWRDCEVSSGNPGYKWNKSPKNLLPPNALSDLRVGDVLKAVATNTYYGSTELFSGATVTGVKSLATIARNIEDAGGVATYVRYAYTESGTRGKQEYSITYRAGLVIGAPPIWHSGAFNSSHTTVTMYKSGSSPAEFTITAQWLKDNLKPGDTLEVKVGAQPAIRATIATAKPKDWDVTIDDMRDVLVRVGGFSFTEEVVDNTAQLRVQTLAGGAGMNVSISKVVFAMVPVWGDAIDAVVVKHKRGEVLSYFYVYTYVNDWGWEGAPSPVSGEVEMSLKDTALVSDFPELPTHPDYPGVTNPYHIAKLRLYRTQAGSSGADFFFETEVDWPVVGDVQSDPNRIGEALTTGSWLTAPGVPRGGESNFTESNLTQLVPMWNGMMAGIVDGAVRICEAYTPYAWPLAYELIPPDATPVGLGVYGQNLLVLTTGRPLLVTGSSPEALDQQVLDIPQGCVSARSVVSMGTGVVWASNDGLTWFGLGGTKSLTNGVIAPQTWRDYGPENLIGTQYEGLYMGCFQRHEYEVKSEPLTFFINPEGGSGAFFVEYPFYAAHYDLLQDRTFLANPKRYIEGNHTIPSGIFQWEGNTDRAMQARTVTRVHRFPRPTGFGVLQVQGDPDTETTVRVYRAKHGEEGHRMELVAAYYNLAGNEIRRLPSVRSLEWRVEVILHPTYGAGSARGVRVVLLAGTMQELAARV